MPAAPLTEAIARCITRHQIGSTEPVQPPAWITAAANEIAAAVGSPGFHARTNPDQQARIIARTLNQEAP